jgi:hypothetical protein
MAVENFKILSVPYSQCSSNPAERNKPSIEIPSNHFLKLLHAQIVLNRHLKYWLFSQTVNCLSKSLMVPNVHFHYGAKQCYSGK